MDGQSTAGLLASFDAVLDGLLSLELTSGTGPEVTGLLTELEARRRRLEAVDQRIVAEIADRGIAGEFGRHSAADLLVNLVRVTPGEARARVARAQDLGPRRSFTGEPLQPLLPACAQAAAAGEISPGHVRVISDCLDELHMLNVEQTAAAEAFLVEAARHEHPGQLAKTARILHARLDPDGVEPAERRIERLRGFTLSKRADGSSVPSGVWTAELTAMWETIFDALAAPQPAEDGMPDDRSAPQRRHDALAEAAGRLLRSGTLPAAGGVPVTILVRTSLAELESGSGLAVTGHGSVVSLTALLAMGSDAALTQVVCDALGGVLAYGRTRRLGTRGQRLALAARDGGCCFPGCDRPAAWTEVHHVQAWQDGGETNLDNLCLLCRFHHREFEARGWAVIMKDGVPQWVPPAFIDPDRQPRRNTAHHLDDIDFDVGATVA